MAKSKVLVCMPDELPPAMRRIHDAIEAHANPPTEVRAKHLYSAKVARTPDDLARIFLRGMVRNGQVKESAVRSLRRQGYGWKQIHDGFETPAIDGMSYEELGFWAGEAIKR
jgi:hypothetical protein